MSCLLAKFKSKSKWRKKKAFCFALEKGRADGTTLCRQLTASEATRLTFIPKVKSPPATSCCCWNATRPSSSQHSSKWIHEGGGRCWSRVPGRRAEPFPFIYQLIPPFYEPSTLVCLCLCVCVREREEKRKNFSISFSVKRPTLWRLSGWSSPT